MYIAIFYNFASIVGTVKIMLIVMLLERFDLLFMILIQIYVSPASSRFNLN